MRHHTIVELNHTQDPFGRDLLQHRSQPMVRRIISKDLLALFSHIYSNPMDAQPSVGSRPVLVQDDLRLTRPHHIFHLTNSARSGRRSRRRARQQRIGHMVAHCELAELSGVLNEVVHTFTIRFGCEHLPDGSSRRFARP
jgi:hypothetical protein